MDDCALACLHLMDVYEDPDIVNIGVGPSNAKNFTDHLAVLRPDTMIMVGHCAGIRNHQAVGDFVLASGYILYDTSNVLHHYPEDRYVGAALSLFASVAMMFWYVLRLFMSRD